MDAHESRHELYPPIAPYGHGMLDVGDGHSIYWEQSGNPSGVPVLFLHGGPGAGTTPGHRRFFDPAHYRIILFDQRGAGKSKPFASLDKNTTVHLVGDIEKLRQHLEIDDWFLFGGSWGSTLALVYGESHPERCRGFVLRGVFLGRNEELNWFMNDMRRVYPEAWESFSGFLTEHERNDVLGSYYRRLTDPDPACHMPAADAWNQYETDCSTLFGPTRSTPQGSGPGALALARIEAHYFENGMFVTDNQVLDALERITHLPAVIVQGRYDMICPTKTAVELNRAWERSEIVIVPDAGHSAMEPGIKSALVAATERFKLLA